MTVILDPSKPARLFDGAAKIFSTCRDCGQLLTVISPYSFTHPCCDAKPTEMETLTRQWITALACDEKSRATRLKKAITNLADQPPDLHSAAVDYASWGWPTFPLARHSKSPAIPSAHPKDDPLHGKCRGGCGRPGHGFHDANTDVARIGKWWMRHPSHNIGVATGLAFDVIDVDPRNGGVDSFLELLQTGDLPEVHGIAVTASGGMHLYVKPRNTRCFPGLREGIDYKARGGYVVAPPSTLGQRGRDYTWLVVPSPVLKGGSYG